MSDSIADDQLRSGYQRWLHLEEEKAAIGEDLKELFAELKGQGFAPKALRESFRRVRNIDDADQQEHDHIVDLYVASLTGARPAPAREKDQSDGSGKTQAEVVDTRAVLPRCPDAHDNAEPTRQATVPVHRGRDAGRAENALESGPGSDEAPFEPPAFLKRQFVLRPHCQKPDACGGYGAKHCHACLKAAGELEAA